MSRFDFLRKAPLPAKSGRDKPKTTLLSQVKPIAGCWEGVDNRLRFAQIRVKRSWCFLDIGLRKPLGNRVLKETLRLHLLDGRITAGKERLPVDYDPVKDEIVIGNGVPYKRLKIEINET